MECTAGCTILIVEDDIESAENMSYFLKPHFMALFVAHSVGDALLLHEKKKPDFILTDLELSDKNGLEMIKSIRTKDDSVSIVVLTGHQKDEYMMEAIPLRLSHFLLKPITSAKLISVLESTCKTAIAETRLSDGVFYSFKRKQIFRNDIWISLTNKEISLIELFLMSKNRIVSYQEIEELLYQDSGMSKNAVRVLVKKIRQKCSEIEITNHVGLGYELVFERERERVKRSATNDSE